MNKLFISAILALSFVAMPVTAQQTTMTKAEIKAAMKAEKATKKRSKDNSAVVVVAPTPVVTPAPTPVVTPTPTTVVTTQPTSTITPYMQAQIAAALARPNSFNCTYCAAYAASQGDLETVAAIGAGTYMQTQPVATTDNAPVDAVTTPTQDTQEATPSESVSTEPTAVTQ